MILELLHHTTQKKHSIILKSNNLEHCFTCNMWSWYLHLWNIAYNTRSRPKYQYESLNENLNRRKFIWCSNYKMFYKKCPVVARNKFMATPTARRIFIKCITIVLVLAALFHRDNLNSQCFPNCFDIVMISVGNNHCNEQYIRNIRRVK